METGNRKREKGDRRRETAMIILKKFSTNNLLGKCIHFLRMLIANQTYKLAVAAKSAKWGSIF